MIRSMRPLFILLCLLVSAGQAPAGQQGRVPLQRITVALDDNYPPYIFRDNGGHVQGILVDQWKLWEKRTGIKVDLMAMDWAKAQEAMLNQRADVIDTIFKTPRRELVYEFSKPYAKIEVPIFFHKSISGITDIESVQGFSVGVKKGDACIEIFRQHGITRGLVEYDGYEAIIADAARKKLRVFCVDKPPAFYYLNKYNIAEDFHYSLPLYTGEFHRAVSRGRSDLLAVVEKGFAGIGKDQYAAIDRKWFGEGILQGMRGRTFVIALLAALGASFFLLAFIVLLRREVKAKTAELTSTNRRLQEEIRERRTAEDHLKESESYLASIVEANPTGTIIVDRETRRIAYVNKAAAGIIGLDRQDVLGKVCHCLVCPAGEDACPVSDLGQLVDRSERVLIKGDGTRVPILKTVVPMTVQGRSCLLESFIDITDRRRLEEERERLQSQLLQSQKMESVGRLAGGVAHDFNNVLQAILGYAEIAMAKVEPDSSLHGNLQEILKAGRHSAELTHQLLAFARKQVAHPRLLDLNRTVKGMLTMLKRLIGEDIELQWVPDAELWNVRMDPTQINQILANLVVNARDAISGEGKISIQTANRVIDEDFCVEHLECIPGEYVMLSVSDDGSGMNREVLDKIFEPFFTTKALGQGTGLGLATVYGIVKQNEGLIVIESRENHGTTVMIFLPRHGGKGAQEGAEREESAARRGAETVLVVEDNETVLNLCIHMLQGLGYTVLSAQAPGEALRIAGEYAGEIHLLITDVVMPGINGHDLAKKIGIVRPGLKCLFMSGYTADIISRHGIMGEGVRFLQKPFTARALGEKVREALEDG